MQVLNLRLLATPFSQTLRALVLTCDDLHSLWSRFPYNSTQVFQCLATQPKLTKLPVVGSIPTEVKDFFFASCGYLIPFTRANAQWVIHGSISTLIYTSELILCFTICVLSATRHNIHIYPIWLPPFGIIFLLIWKILMSTNFLNKLSCISSLNSLKIHEISNILNI